jgi:cobyrinic acid a,c-diamide synthase
VPVDNKVAFVIAGTHSGCGKTTVALALMAAFQARGRRVQPFKVGPDFIDPGFHTRLTGRASRNLDGWMLSHSYNVTQFRHLLRDADVGIVEGVMGLFDGYDGMSEAGSSAEMAKWLGIPVILVVDAASMARSAAALVYGFSRFDPALRVAGVIFNRIGSPGHYQYLQTAMAANLPDIAVLGAIPRDRQVSLPERHLGLVMADELALDHDWLGRVQLLAEQHIDLERLSALARWEEADSAVAAVEAQPAGTERPGAALHDRAVAPVIAVARDAAFCFYYADNLEALQVAGAALHYFSPLAGEPLPPGVAGLYLGGGYPELHAERLSTQQGFFEGIRRAVQHGMPVYAECGGMMVLGRFIETGDGRRFPMAGILPFGTRMLSRRKALGYTEILVREACLLGEPGTRVRGHEFHYSEIVERTVDAPVLRAYELQGRHGSGKVMEGYQVGSVLASYVHLHFGSAEGVAEHLVAACRSYRARLDQEGGQSGAAR